MNALPSDHRQEELPICGGSFGFGCEVSVRITRSSDIVIKPYLQVVVPAVELSPNNRFGANGSLRWSRNFLHALIKSAGISFNDLLLNTFTGVFLDFYASFFASPEGSFKYWADIGNVDELTNPRSSGGSGKRLPEMTLRLPLPLYQRDGKDIGLPMFLLPYVECKINFSFRDWTELLILDCVPCEGSHDPLQSGLSVPAVASDLLTAPSSFDGKVFVSCYDLDPKAAVCMAEVPQFFNVDQFYANPVIGLEGSPLLPNITRPVRMPRGCMLFGIRNTTNPAEWSNYTPASPVVTSAGVMFTTGFTVSPLEEVQFTQSGVEIRRGSVSHYTFVEPWTNGMSLPTIVGCHAWVSAINTKEIASKALESEITIKPSPQLIVASGAKGTFLEPDCRMISLGLGVRQTYELLLFSKGTVSARISGGVISVEF